MNIGLKQNFCAIIFCFLFSTILVAQTPYQPENLIKKVVTEIQVDLTSITIKDNDGNTLGVQTALSMLQSENYDMETYVDDEGQIKEIVLRLKQGATINDKQLSENALKDELERIRIKDQALRSLLACYTKTPCDYLRAEELQFLILLMNQHDLENEEQVTKIIDENGWLGISQVGEIANSALFLVIQHASVETQEKYFPLLKESAEKGESRLANMALMDDRIRMYRNMKQLYGSQTKSVEGKAYVWPIEDAENVDQRRKEVQLQPLAEYLELLGLTYPDDELPAELF